MKAFAVLAAALLLPACATLGTLGGSGESRTELWRQAHVAFARDSFRLAEERFARLSAEHPRSHEGRESLFYLGVLSLEPRGRVDFQQAIRHFDAYLAADSVRPSGWHVREARTLQRFARVLATPCGERVPAILCEPAAVDTVTRTTPGAPSAPSGASAAELARLRTAVANRDARIRELEAELQRIRNTLAPRNPRD